MKKVSNILATHERHYIITYSDVTAGLVLEQLTRDVFARGTCSRWHFAVVLPVTAGRVCIKSRRCRVCNPGGRNQSRRFACDQKNRIIAFSRWIFLFSFPSLPTSLSLSLCTSISIYFSLPFSLSFSLFLRLPLSPCSPLTKFPARTCFRKSPLRILAVVRIRVRLYRV